jgi:hypothetical protein
MNEKLLIETTIQQYLEMLKEGKATKELQEISDLLSSKVSIITGGFDLALFQLQKDLFLITCKYTIAVFEFDQAGQIKYAKRIEDLKRAIEKKKQSNEEVENDPYKSFLEWLFTLKKYYGSEVDRSNTLLELIVATEQMIKFYENQNQQIEKQKAK